jgi:hypothetical protein
LEMRLTKHASPISARVAQVVIQCETRDMYRVSQFFNMMKDDHL